VLFTVDDAPPLFPSMGCITRAWRMIEILITQCSAHANLKFSEVLHKSSLSVNPTGNVS